MASRNRRFETAERFAGIGKAISSIDTGFGETTWREPEA